MNKETDTSGAEWVGSAAVVLIAIIAIVLIYYLLVTKSRTSTQGVVYKPSSTIVCATSVPPTNLTAVIRDISRPTFDASWTGVTSPFTTGATILGYNIFVNDTPGITAQNTTSGGFTPVAQVRVRNYGKGDLKFNTTYYYRVATVDTCGQGALSDEEFQIDL